MNVYTCNEFALSLPVGHSFPMQKYTLLHAVIAERARELGISLCVPEPASDNDVLRVHCPQYVERVRIGTLSIAEQRKIGFPWSQSMADRTRRVSGATKMALFDALAGDGVAVNLAGGTHHAFYDSGGGYCIFNDAVIAARAAIAAGRARRILVIDLDVHQGNGTAALCQHDPSITTFSVHGARNYPAVKQQSDFDLALATGTGDDEYLTALAAYLPKVFAHAQPDGVVYLAGADPYELDRLGLLKLSKSGLAARDQMVLKACLAHDAPVAVAMAGGYAPDVADIVEIHAKTVTLAAHSARQWCALRRKPAIFDCTVPSE